MARPTGRPIRTELVAAAMRRIQTVGVAAFTFREVGDEVGITTASMHHHFRHRDDLVAEVARTYRAQFAELLAEIGTDRAIERLSRYAALFEETAAADRMCLCGATLAAWSTVGVSTRAEVDGFVDDQIDWLTAEIGRGVADGDFRHDLDAAATAETVFAALEGALLLDRAGRGGRRTGAVAAQLAVLVRR